MTDTPTMTELLMGWALFIAFFGMWVWYMYEVKKLGDAIEKRSDHHWK